MQRKFEDLEFNSNWKFKILIEKFSFNSQYSYRHSLRPETISGNWKPLTNHEKYFLLHLNKLNLLLTNQILLLLCTCIKVNVLYPWSLKLLAIKRWFVFKFAKILLGRHFVMVERKNFKLLVNISFESRLFKMLYCRVYCYFRVPAIKLI